MIEIATVVQTSLKYDNSCCEGIGLGRDCKHGKGCQKEQSKSDVGIGPAGRKGYCKHGEGT